MTRKIFTSLIFCLLLSLTVSSNSPAQDELLPETGGDNLKAHRAGVLEGFKKTVEFHSSGYRAESEHFKIRLDSKRSREELGLDEEELKNFLLGTLYIFEEAYRLVGDDFDYYPPAKYDLKILSKEEFALAVGDYSFLYTGSRLEIGFTSQEAKSVLSDFQEKTILIYDAYTTIALRAQKGLRGSSETSDEIREFETGKAAACSRWLHAISTKERRELVDAFNKENVEIYQDYPDYLKNAELTQEPMKCKWCGKDVDISKEKTGRRIKCPYCRNLITVER